MNFLDQLVMNELMAIIAPLRLHNIHY